MKSFVTASMKCTVHKKKRRKKDCRSIKFQLKLPTCMYRISHSGVLGRVRCQSIAQSYDTNFMSVSTNCTWKLELPRHSLVLSPAVFSARIFPVPPSTSIEKYAHLCFTLICKRAIYTAT